jgi:Domain of unknown function (DUF1843)
VTTNETAGEPLQTLYGPAIRASLKKGDLTELKATLAAAEELHRRQGDLRGAVASARTAFVRLKS